MTDNFQTDLEQDWLISIKHLHGKTFKHLQGRHNQKLHGNRGPKVSNEAIKGLPAGVQGWYNAQSTQDQVKFRLAWYRELKKNPNANATAFAAKFVTNQSPAARVAAVAQPKAAPTAPAAPPPPPPVPTTPAKLTLAQAKAWYSSLPTQLDKNRFRTAWHHELKKNPNAVYEDFAEAYIAKKKLPHPNAQQQPAAPTPAPAAATPTPNPNIAVVATPIKNAAAAVPAFPSTGATHQVNFTTWKQGLNAAESAQFSKDYAKYLKNGGSLSEAYYAPKWAQAQNALHQAKAAPAPAPAPAPTPASTLAGGTSVTTTMQIRNYRDAVRYRNTLSTADQAKFVSDWNSAPPNMSLTRFAQQWQKQQVALNTPVTNLTSAKKFFNALSQSEKVQAMNQYGIKGSPTTAAGKRSLVAAMQQTQLQMAAAKNPAPAPAPTSAANAPAAASTPAVGSTVNYPGGVKVTFLGTVPAVNVTSYRTMQQWYGGLNAADKKAFNAAFRASGSHSKVAFAMQYQKQQQAGQPVHSTPAAPAPKQGTSSPLSTGVVGSPKSADYRSWYNGMNADMKKQFNADLADYRASATSSAAAKITPLRFSQMWVNGHYMSSNTVQALVKNNVKLESTAQVHKLVSGMDNRVAQSVVSLPHASDQAAYIDAYNAHIAGGGTSANALAVMNAWVNKNVAGGLSERMTGKFKNQVSAGEIDVSAVQKDKNWFHNFKHANSQDQLKMINDLNGFNGNPKVVNKSDMDAIVNDGGTEIWRGISSPTNYNRKTGQNEPTYVKNFMDEPPSYQGSGMFGDGWYTSDTQRIFNTHYCNPWGMRMSLSKKARLYDYDQLKRDMVSELSAVRSGSGKYARLSQRERGIMEQVFGDEGRFASWMGYDAIKVTNPIGRRAGGVANKDYYVVLNRTAVAIQQQFYDKNTGKWVEMMSVGTDAFKEFDNLFMSAFQRRTEELWATT